MNCKCYICGTEIKHEHYFLAEFKGYKRIMCRKCGVKYRKDKYRKKGEKDVIKEGVGQCINH